MLTTIINPEASSNEILKKRFHNAMLTDEMKNLLEIINYLVFINHLEKVLRCEWIFSDFWSSIGDVWLELS